MTGRILEYLSWAKENEADPWLKDDLHIAWLTVFWASRGHSQPHVYATQLTLGLHPDQLWPAIEARRRVKLGPYYEKFYPQFCAEALPRAKAPQAARPALSGPHTRTA